MDNVDMAIACALAYTSVMVTYKNSMWIVIECLPDVVPFAFVRSLANPPVFLATNLSQAEASRRSAEYVRMPPSQPKISRLQGERSQSFSSYSPPPPFDHLNRQNHGPMSAGHSQYGPPAVKKPPIVYPALLSRVANAFVQRITTSPRIKDSIEYKDCFDGRDAVVSFYEALYFSTYSYHTRKP